MSANSCSAQYFFWYGAKTSVVSIRNAAGVRIPRPRSSGVLHDSFLVSSDRNQISRELLFAALGDEWPADLIQTAAEMLADSESRFPSGPRSLPGDLVRAIQRERLLVGMLRAVSDLGYRSTNVQDVIERAGVSRPTFYEHFSNKDDCFLAAFDTCAARLRDQVATAADEAGDVWRDRIRSGFNALLSFAAAEPEAARMVIVEARAATPDAALRRVALLDHFASCIDDKVRELLPGRHHPLGDDRLRRRRRRRIPPLRAPQQRPDGRSPGPPPLAHVLRRAPV